MTLVGLGLLAFVVAVVSSWELTTRRIAGRTPDRRTGEHYTDTRPQAGCPDCRMAAEISTELLARHVAVAHPDRHELREGPVALLEGQAA